jgi:outer membrane lipoprotein-sorting protein
MSPAGPTSSMRVRRARCGSDELDERSASFRLAQAGALPLKCLVRMSYLLRRLPLSRLLLLCGVALIVGVSLTALASALDTGPTPAPKPLANAVHDALVAQPVEGVSAQIQWTDRLLEGANLATGGGEAGQLSSSPLVSGASGRLWISKEGRVRLELQSEKGDTQVYYDGHTVSLYDASSNTLYRYTPPAHEDSGPGTETCDEGGSTQTCLASKPTQHEAPSVAKIEEAISRLSRHANVSGATPADVAGQAAYTVRVSPKETGSLLGGAELSWDAIHGVPLRAAVYSTESLSSVFELAATSISYGPIEPSVFQFTPPANATVKEVAPSAQTGSTSGSGEGGEHPSLTTHGHGLSMIAVVEQKAKTGAGQSSPLPEGLPQVKIDGTSATELATELGTVLTFERSGVRYLLAGAVSPGAVEAIAKGL